MTKKGRQIFGQEESAPSEQILAVPMLESDIVVVRQCVISY